MAGAGGSGSERVNVFAVDELYLFKHYFEGAAVFSRLEQYYNNQGYRFEIPPSEFNAVQRFLSEHGYRLETVEDLVPYVVVVEQYTDHPENIFKGSVIHRAADGHNCFLMTDRGSVAEAVESGAARLAETDVENPF